MVNRFLTVLILLGMPLMAWGNQNSLSYTPVRAFDNYGKPFYGGKASSHRAGTFSSDSRPTTSNTNPVASDYREERVIDQLALQSATGSTTRSINNAGPNRAGNITISSNTTLTDVGYIAEGTIYNVANGVTLTITGSVSAGLYQIFNCTGTGKIVFNRANLKEVYPQWWGAKGDGTTDDSTPITKAAVSVKHGGIIFFPPGTYIASHLQFGDIYGETLTGVTFQGGNRDYTKIVSNSNVGNVFEFYKCPSITLDNLYFDGGAAITPNKTDAAAGHYLRTVIFYGCPYPTVTHCQFTRAFCEALVFHYSADATPCTDVKADHNLLVSNYGSGIVLKTVVRATVSYNIITNWNTHGDDWQALWAITCDDVAVNNNICHLTSGTNVPKSNSCIMDGCVNSGFNFNILECDVNIPQAQLTITDLQSSRAMVNCTFIGNTIKGTGSVGMEAVFTTFANQNINISNNSIYGQPYGITVTGKVSHLNIFGNMIYTPITSNINQGIRLEAKADGVPDYVTIAGNTLCGNDKTQPNSWGICILNKEAEIQHLNINGNTISTYYYPLKANDAKAWKASLVGNLVDDVTWSTMYLGGAKGTLVHRMGNVKAGTMTELDVSGMGIFKCDNNKDTEVINVYVTDQSIILLEPTNAAAATLMGGPKSLYVSVISAGKSFTVSTADGTAASGRESFKFRIAN